MDVLLRRKIEFLSFFFSIYVVLFHVCPTPEEYLWCNNDILFLICKGINHYITHFGTYANLFFVFISAFLLYYNITRNNCVEKLKRRVFSLFIPLVLWNLIYVLPFVIIRGEEFRILDVIFSRYCVPMWFITALLVYLILLPLIDLITKNNYIGIAVCLIILLLNSRVIDILTSFMGEWRYYPEVTRFVDFVGIYIAGAIVGRHFFSVFSEERYRNCKLIKVIFILGLVLPFICDFVSIDNQFISIIHVMAIWGIIGKKRFERELPKFIGDSFGIFAIHTGLLIILVTIFVKNGVFLENTDIHFVIYLLGRAIVVTCFVIISLLLTHILRRFTPRIYRILYGSRNI